MDITFLFTIPILIMSVVIHEVSHGYAALFLGDVTAKYAGRLTMNPIKHLDLFGSVILPLILSLFPGGIIFGWAKPVPYNPYNLKNKRWGELIVAAAGPLSNILVAMLLGVAVRFAVAAGVSQPVIVLTVTAIFINLFLAIFNLVPIPPLDGSKILFGLAPKLADRIREAFEKYGLIFLLIFIYFFSSIIVPIVIFLTELMTGLKIS